MWEHSGIFPGWLSFFFLLYFLFVVVTSADEKEKERNTWSRAFTTTTKKDLRLCTPCFFGLCYNYDRGDCLQFFFQFVEKTFEDASISCNLSNLICRLINEGTQFISSFVRLLNHFLDGTNNFSYSLNITLFHFFLFI